MSLLVVSLRTQPAEQVGEALEVLAVRQARDVGVGRPVVADPGVQVVQPARGAVRRVGVRPRRRGRLGATLGPAQRVRHGVLNR